MGLSGVGSRPTKSEKEAREARLTEKEARLTYDKKLADREGEKEADLFELRMMERDQPDQQRTKEEEAYQRDIETRISYRSIRVNVGKTEKKKEMALLRFIEKDGKLQCQVDGEFDGKELLESSTNLKHIEIAETKESKKNKKKKKKKNLTPGGGHHTNDDNGTISDGTNDNVMAAADINDYIIKIICKTNKGKQDSILIYLEGMADDDIKKLLEALYWISHKDDGIIKDEAKLFEEMSQYGLLPHPLKLKRARRRLTEADLPRSSYLHSAEEVLARRRLVDHARMQAKDVDTMSPSELVMQ